jgi:FixJ family two-component response regulator
MLDSQIIGADAAAKARLASAVEGSVYLVDDNEDVRETTKALLQSFGLTVHAFTNGQAFLDSLSTPVKMRAAAVEHSSHFAHHAFSRGPAASREAEHNRCLLLDIMMPGLDGLQLQDKLIARKFDLPIVFMTGHGRIPTAVEVIKKGAINYLEKPFSDEQLLAAIRDAFAAYDRAQSAAKSSAHASALLEALSEREREVYERLTTGKLNKVVAAELDISVRTVEMHRKNIMTKMGVRSVAELIQKTRP